MKPTLVIFVALGACVIIAVILYSRAVHPRLLAPVGPLTFDAQGSVAEFPSSAAIVASIQAWVAAHQSGWRLSFVTYAARSHFSCDAFSVEVGDRYIVLNYARRRGGVFTEVVRDLTPDEQSFWRDIVDTANRPNQAMQPTAGRRTFKLSMTPTPTPATTRALASGGCSCSR
ncbi:MAG: hypothetical protein ABI787_09550 [Spartobacteria bacterium]